MKRTVLYDQHISIGARMIEFAGWKMPVHYSTGIVEEHLQTRKRAGLFDISHMGRFIIRGGGALEFIHHVLTNNAAGLVPGFAQYTMIQNDQGGALDDAYLYRFFDDEYLLVVNAANMEKDRDHLQKLLNSFSDVELIDRTEVLSMLSLQGSISREILLEVLDQKRLPEPFKNSLLVGHFQGKKILIARTGYTGESIGFELFTANENVEPLWQKLIGKGAVPVGLGARDSLRLEAGLPLYGHELGSDPDGNEIPIFACPLARFAVSFSPLKGNFIGREALLRQFEAYKRILRQDFSAIVDLPRIIRPLWLLDKGIARAGAGVFTDKEPVGRVTSGTMIPFWKVHGEGLSSRLTYECGKRSVCLALIDSNLSAEHERVSVDIRGRRVDAVTVPFHLRSEAPPYSRAILYDEDELFPVPPTIRRESQERIQQDVFSLLEQAIENTRWRQEACINLIPSEQTQSQLVRLLTVMDPSFRYGEHQKVKAFYDSDVFYYQGTEFITEVERRLEEEFRKFLGCQQVEARTISGQMANMTVFSALVDYLNREDRKSEPRRIRSVMNNHIIKGGHLSAQPMGALRDFVAWDPETDKPAVINFPVLPDNPYKIDISQVSALLEQYRPELIILGKSMIIHKEPVSEIRSMVEDLSLGTLIMYDMAHVLGLVGPHFQEPFKEGADIVTGSTHKTYFGTQRGIIASELSDEDHDYPFWEAIQRRAFPGSVSNHHLGTLLGLLLAAYEMNAFKEEYQQKVLANAKALALALRDCGMDIAGDPEISYTETHQVIVRVGYNKGVDAARRLEENNIIVNFQAAPEEEGFTASGCLRLGTAEMTRFGMEENDFKTVAEIIRDIVVDGKRVREEVRRIRDRFRDLRFCFSGRQIEQRVEELHSLI